MTQKKYTDGNGVSEIWLNIKNYVYSQLLGKADSIHTHTKNQITDFPSLATVATSGSYNDLTDKPTIPSPYSPPTFTYDSTTETLTMSNTTATVITYDANSETLEVQING